MWGGSSDEEEDDLKTDRSENPSEGSRMQPNEKENPEMSDEEDQDENGKKENKKDKQLDEEDEEMNDDQVDPYHGHEAPQPEIEPLDLPEDMNIEEQGGGDEQDNMENPFDLDNAENKEITEEDLPDDDAGSDKEDIENEKKELSDTEDQDASNMDPITVENEKEPEENEKTEDTEEIEAGEEETPQDEENVNADSMEESAPVDEQVEDKVDENEKSSGEKESLKQEDEGKDENLESEGNENATTKKESSAEDSENAPESFKQSGDPVKDENETNKNDESSENTGQQEDDNVQGEDKHQNKGTSGSNQMDSDDTSKQKQQSKREQSQKRSLLEGEQDTENKRLKTVDAEEKKSENAEENDNSDPNKEQEPSELYKHVEEAKPNDKVTLDNATKEESEKQSKSNINLKPEEQVEETKDDEESEIMEVQETDLESKKEKNQSNSKPDKKKKDSRDENNDEDTPMEVDGDIVLTTKVQRPAESSYVTIAKLLNESSMFLSSESEDEESANMRDETAEVFCEPSLLEWRQVERTTLPLAQELCEQLRLILEPTQASRLKGDYKTGKRLNMRKVIPYIASGFRKDKIWMRRTQPSKREYQIMLALDDSASMSDNQSRQVRFESFNVLRKICWLCYLRSYLFDMFVFQMALSSVAVLSQALNLLEAGKLSVVSFGEEVSLLHSFEDQFTELSGMRLIEKLTFAQKRTRVAQLMKVMSSVFSEQVGPSSLEIGKLLLIISDGRAVCHEGSDVVRKAIVNARENNIFIVFIIVDNPENSDSILDIRQPIFSKDSSSVQICNYMDSFPFPFYIILKELTQLPSVLADALKQWFTLFVGEQ